MDGLIFCVVLMFKKHSVTSTEITDYFLLCIFLSLLFHHFTQFRVFHSIHKVPISGFLTHTCTYQFVFSSVWNTLEQLKVNSSICNTIGFPFILCLVNKFILSLCECVCASELFSIAWITFQYQTKYANNRNIWAWILCEN